MSTIPTIGMEGFYTLLPPFDVLIKIGEIYRCESIRSLREYSKDNTKTLQIIYLANGLTEADYLLDLDSNESIVFLQSGESQWVIVPATYISGWPDSSGVSYHNVVIGVNIGAVPTTYDLEPLKTLFSNITHTVIGTTPVVKEIQASKTILVKPIDHQAIETARNVNRVERPSDAGRVVIYQDQLTQALAKIQELETIIRTHVL